MKIEAVILVREELYDLIWSIPLLQLAKRYGLSDRGLAKICKKMEIPLPGVGYWAKAAAGKAVEKPPLPLLSASGIVHYEIQAINIAPSHPPPEVPTDLENLHPLVEQTRTALKAISIGPSASFLLNRESPHLDIRTRPDSLGRAIRIMNVVVLELESEGHMFSIERSHDGFKTLVSVDMDKVSIRLAERVGQNHGYDHKSSTSPTYISTGELEISFERRNGIWKSWKDKKRHPIEESLGEFIGAIKAVAREFRETRERREVYEEQQRNKEREHAERERIKSEKRDFLRSLELQAEYWSRAEALRGYLASVESAAANGKFDVENQEQFSLWLQTSRNLADELDPITGNWSDSPPDFSKKDPEQHVHHYHHSSSTPSYAPWWFVKHRKGW